MQKAVNQKPEVKPNTPEYVFNRYTKFNQNTFTTARRKLVCTAQGSPRLSPAAEAGLAQRGPAVGIEEPFNTVVGNSPNTHINLHILSHTREDIPRDITVRGTAGQPRFSDLRRPITPTRKQEERNTKRGLRSEKASLRRRLNRTMKRQTARQTKRRSKLAYEAFSAQEPDRKNMINKGTRKLTYASRWKIATINVKSIKQDGQREMVEQWMKKHDIFIASIQETKIEHNQKEVRSQYTWFFSGEQRTCAEGRFEAGVAIVIANKIMNMVQDVQPVSDRIMRMTLSYATPITVISVYAPTANRSRKEKDLFYETLQNTYQKAKNIGCVFIAGDLNARVQCKRCDEEEAVGKWTFDKTNLTFDNQSDDTADNRQRLLEFCETNNIKLANTLFPKPACKLVTYREIGIQHGPPWIRKDAEADFGKRYRYECLDYILVPQRWRNAIQNLESDVMANINTDHYPLICTIRLKLKGKRMQDKQKQRLKLEKASEEQKERYNQLLQDALSNLHTYEERTGIIYDSAVKHLPQKPTQAIRKDITRETLELINKRGEAMKTNAPPDQIAQLTREIKKQRRQEKRTNLLATVSAAVDNKNIWQGIRNLKSTYKPSPYNKVDRDGRHVPKEEHAESAAMHLATNQWGQIANAEEVMTDEYIVDDIAFYDVSPIHITELGETIRRCKKGKACGPDDIPMECFAEMNMSQLLMTLDMLNEWWNQEEIPSEVLKARVVLIFKKGDSSKWENYRPISLLNSLYKLFAAILKKRISHALDPYLQKTQYGFRANRSTADALHCVRRVIDVGESTGRKTLLVLLDWEKAFDKIDQRMLFHAMERMRIHPKLVALTRAMYAQPQFCVELDGQTSNWYIQLTGIRQGCPLSPYLFLIVMTTMFHDIHKNDRCKLKDHRVTGASFDEILYADDTICVSEDTAAVNRHLKAIEEMGAAYGLKLNKTKCELIQFGNRANVHFADGTPVPKANTAKYLGCLLNDKGDATAEVRNRLTQCIIVWRKLELFWKHADCPTSFKLHVYDAVIRTKLLYGLESAQLNNTTLAAMNTFQLKGLRQILKLQTTYVDRANSNARVFEIANARLRTETGNAEKELRQISEMYKDTKIKALLKLLKAPNDDPRKHITLDAQTLAPLDLGKRRVGRPRAPWYLTTLQDYWDRIGKSYNTSVRNIELDLSSQRHRDILWSAVHVNFPFYKTQTAEIRNRHEPQQARANVEGHVDIAWIQGENLHTSSLATARR